MPRFGWREPSEVSRALKRAQKLLRETFVVEKIAESDWLFGRTRKEQSLLSMWAFRDPDRERPQKQAPVDGLIWDVSWYYKKRGLNEGQIAMARAAAGRGSVESHGGGFLKPTQVFFYDRKITDLDFDDADAKAYLEASIDAVGRMLKAINPK